MPLFMDIHQKLPEGATATDVADAHMADLARAGQVRCEVRQLLGR